MPLYTYECLACDIIEEHNITIAKRDEAKCPRCGNYLRRKIDAPGAVYAPTSKSGLAV